MRSLRKFQYSSKQRGAATLFVSIILLLAVTVLVIFAARVGIQDQKISGNQYRHKIAFANAEAGMEQAASYLKANSILYDFSADDGWQDCAGSLNIFPCSLEDAESVLANVVVGNSITSVIPSVHDNANSFLVQSGDSIYAVGTGTTDDASGEAVAIVSFSRASLLTSGELPPLMMPSGNLSGSFNIVPNPNGGGPGVSISAWVKNVQTNTGSWNTCHHGDFQNGNTSDVCIDTLDDNDSWSACSCKTVLSSSSDVNDDIVENDFLSNPVPFPESPFAFLFGAEDENTDGDGEMDTQLLNQLKAEIKARAETTGKLLASCEGIDNINLATDVEVPLIWVTGNCSIPAGSMIGDRTTPVILVVEGDITVNANVELWGILMGLAQFTMNGGPVIHGSAISEYESKLTNGDYSQVYDEAIFEALRGDGDLTYDIAKVKYSWRDFSLNN